VNDLDALLRKLRRDGFTIKRSRGTSHWHVRDKAGRLVAVTSSTPSDRRSLRNFRRDLRRAEAGARRG
jgi:predicted RNA binding protein YcfA (HicA-like mRNA interferase family)